MNLPKQCFIGAAGGGGWNGMVSYLPLPRWGALSGKSARTCRRWRLSSCVLILACSPQCRTRAGSARAQSGAARRFCIRTYAALPREGEIIVRSLLHFSDI
jgi:hypothetical protein